MQCACAILSSVACPTLQNFSTLSHKRHVFEKMLLNTKYVFWFSVQLLSETFLILRRNERDVMKNVFRSACKVPDILSDFNETWIFSRDFRKFLKYEILWKSVQWETRCFMRTDGQMDRHDEANSRFSQTCWTSLLSYLFTYSMVLSPSWEANWFAASQEIPRILWNPNVHYRTHKIPPPVPILG